MTQKKLRMVRARLFAACPVRRGAWYLDAECSARPSGSVPRAAHGCGAVPAGAVSRTIDHARPAAR